MDPELGDLQLKLRQLYNQQSVWVLDVEGPTKLPEGAEAQLHNNKLYMSADFAEHKSMVESALADLYARWQLLGEKVNFGEAVVYLDHRPVFLQQRNNGSELRMRYDLPRPVQSPPKEQGWRRAAWIFMFGFVVMTLLCLVT